MVFGCGGGGGWEREICELERGGNAVDGWYGYFLVSSYVVWTAV